MFRILLLLNLAFLVFSCSNVDTAVVFLHVKNAQTGGKISLVTKDSCYISYIDSTSTATFNINTSKKWNYANIKFNDVNLPIYVEPTEDLDIFLSFADKHMDVSFEGKTSKINSYLNTNPFKNINVDYALPENQFINSLDSIEKTLFNRLDSLGFDKDFCDYESQRIHYVVYTYLGLYPSYHSYFARVSGYKPSEDYYNALKSAIVENDELLESEEYNNAWVAMIETFGERYVSRYKVADYTEDELKFVLMQIKNPRMLEKFVHKILLSYVDRFGIEDWDRFSNIYKENVISHDKKLEFDRVFNKWLKISVGCISPDFECYDVHGKKMTLKDFRGKYLYLDVWATWCGPCRGELPYLKELIKSFKNKNIEFISISCDTDKDEWLSFIKRESLHGVQLILGEDRSFMDDYIIKRIPRIILLDQEGKVISSNMTRPSNEKTKETLAALDGI